MKRKHILEDILISFFNILKKVRVRIILVFI